MLAAWRRGTKQERQQFIKYPQEFEWSLAAGPALPAMPLQSHATFGSRGEHGAALPDPQAHKPNTQHWHFHSLLLKHVLPNTHLFFDFSHQAETGNRFLQSGNAGLPCSDSQGLALLQPLWGCNTLNVTFVSLLSFFFPSHICLETEVNVHLLEFT